MVEVCRAAAWQSCTLDTDLDMHEFTPPTNFLLSLFAEEQTDTVNESLSFCVLSTAETISQLVGNKTALSL